MYLLCILFYLHQYFCMSLLVCMCQQCSKLISNRSKNNQEMLGSLCAVRALHSELFSEIRVKFRVGTSFSRVETRRVLRHFFVTFKNFGKMLLSKLAKTKFAKKRVFSRFFCDFFANFCKKTRFFVKIRVGMSFRKSERVRQKLEKLVSTWIFGKTWFPKLAKTKILAKAVFRRALCAVPAA